MPKIRADKPLAIVRPGISKVHVDVSEPLTPEQSRQLAYHLIEIAEVVERKAPTVH